MTKNTTKKILTISLASLAIGLGLVTTIGVSAHMGGQNKAEQDALLSGDLTAFKTAISTENQKKVDNLTQEKFDQLSARAREMQAVQKTIEANDYNAFKTAAPENLKTKIDSQAKFDELVTKNKEMAANFEKVIAAIKEGNFDNYKVAMQAARPNKMDKTENADFQAKQETMIKARFEEQVAYYKKDGTLPTKPFGMMGFGKMDKQTDEANLRGGKNRGSRNHGNERGGF